MAVLRLSLVPDVVVPPVALGGAAHQPGELIPGQLLALSVTTIELQTISFNNYREGPNY